MNKKYKKFLFEGSVYGDSFDFCSGHGLRSVGGGRRYGKRTGNSLEFMEHRDYQEGDDLRTLDWSVYGRTDRLVVKMFQEEISPKLDLVIDCSRSMDVEGFSKVEAQLKLAGLLSKSASNSGFLVRSWLCRNDFKMIVNGHLTPEQWDGIEFTGDIAPSLALKSQEESFQFNSLRIFISDLLWEEHPRKTLASLSKNSRGVFVIQLLDSKELRPKLEGNNRLVDIESGYEEDLFIDSGSIRHYLEALNSHIYCWEQSCRESNSNFITLESDVVCGEWDVTKLIEVGLISRSV